jgi:hypothetical protein
MIIKITENTLVNEIQEAFHKRFPYLKIELFENPHEVGEGSALKNQLPNNITLGEASGKTKKGVISLNGLMKVAELEQNFQDTFGVAAQVFRKSGDVWLQTTATDNWTLAEQNNRGRESLGLPADDSVPIDYREQE